MKNVQTFQILIVYELNIKIKCTLVKLVKMDLFYQYLDHVSLWIFFLKIVLMKNILYKIHMLFKTN